MLVELFGLAGVIAGSSWGLFRRRHAILGVQGLATLFFGAHYLVLGAMSGAAMCSLTLVQTAASLPERRSRATAVLFWATVPLMVVLTALTWNGIASAGAAFGLTMATLGRWQTDLVRLRVFFVLCALGWAVHNIVIGSPFGLVSDAMCLGTNLWRLWLDRPRRERPVLALPTLGQPAA